jgi:hypothetical protein
MSKITLYLITFFTVFYLVSCDFSPKHKRIKNEVKISHSITDFYRYQIGDTLFHYCSDTCKNEFKYNIDKKNILINTKTFFDSNNEVTLFDTNGFIVTPHIGYMKMIEISAKLNDSTTLFNLKTNLFDLFDYKTSNRFNYKFFTGDCDINWQSPYLTNLENENLNFIFTDVRDYPEKYVIIDSTGMIIHRGFNSQSSYEMEFLDDSTKLLTSHEIFDFKTKKAVNFIDLFNSTNDTILNVVPYCTYILNDSIFLTQFTNSYEAQSSSPENNVIIYSFEGVVYKTLTCSAPNYFYSETSIKLTDSCIYLYDDFSDDYFVGTLYRLENYYPFKLTHISQESAEKYEFSYGAAGDDDEGVEGFNEYAKFQNKNKKLLEGKKSITFSFPVYTKKVFYFNTKGDEIIVIEVHNSDI